MGPMLAAAAVALLMAFSNILLCVVDKRNKLSLVVGVGTNYRCIGYSSIFFQKSSRTF